VDLAEDAFLNRSPLREYKTERTPLHPCVLGFTAGLSLWISTMMLRLTRSAVAMYRRHPEVQARSAVHATRRAVRNAAHNDRMRWRRSGLEVRLRGGP
jgi:hypothetical protein